MVALIVNLDTSKELLQPRLPSQIQSLQLYTLMGFAKQQTYWRTLEVYVTTPERAGVRFLSPSEAKGVVDGYIIKFATSIKILFLPSSYLQHAGTRLLRRKQPLS